MRASRLGLLVLLPIISIYLQSTVLSGMRVNGLGPDLIVIFVVFTAILDGKKTGARYGLLCGLLEDLYIGRYIGMNALSLALVGYLIGNFRRLVFPEHVLSPLLAVVLGSFLNQVTNLLIAWIIGVPTVLAAGYGQALLAQIGMQAALTFPLYFWYYNSYRHGALRP